ncbi:MAG: DUF565 domain-containing protein [Leptolyngbyaceae cyanobacterium]
MQRTRLATLVSAIANQFSRWVFNPWRRISLVIISLLLGFFLATAVSSIAGQKAELDVVISAILLALVEAISWWVYRRPPQNLARKNSLLMEVTNAFKIGLIYSLFVEAFKLGS